ncbi:MAG: B12-binding domain-containing radical SAM protein [Thermodesulfobacteriota bacterium]
MKQVLLISFDIIKDGEPPISLSIGSLLSSLKQKVLYGNFFTIEHISFNLYKLAPINIEYIINKIKSKYDVSKFDKIAISCYVWSQYVINELIKELKNKGFKGKIILGGNQITYSNNNEKKYPGCNIFITGYGEDSLLKAICSDDNKVLTFSSTPDFSTLPSPYLTKEIPVKYMQKKVRFETKRGCIYKCKFCAHKNLQNNNIYYHSKKRIFDELLYFKEKNVEKINFTDPTFNSGKGYLDILKFCQEIGMKSKLSLQIRHEKINNNKGFELIELCKSLNCIIEFGLQTINKKEMNVLGRQTNLDKTRHFIKKLNQKNIPFEVSLIYGIPGQTLKSFKKSVTFLIDNGCTNIKAYGLMLLEGTALWKMKNELRCFETCEGKYAIPYVTSSESFTREEWLEMKNFAETLMKQ